MSAVQAARKHGVPSRTLYDKVKKLGITTSRPFKRTSNGSSSCFPYSFVSNVNGGIYSGTLSENENENSNIVMDNASTAMEIPYSKAKDMSTDRESVLDMARRTPSPVVHGSKQKQHQQQMQENIDDQVEDLSVNRKSDVPVIVLPTLDVVKDEIQDTGPDNNDCCDYN